MDVIFLLSLGLLQGVTEFLPVSSSGHLVLFSRWFGVNDSLFVSVVLHVATLLSILVVLRKDVWKIARHPFGDSGMKLMLATIPTCIIALVLMPVINQSFEGAFLPFSFLISAAILLGADVFAKKRKYECACEHISFKTAITMGIAQGLATFPGVSRSGTTISAGLISGGNRNSTAKFSFLMSIPIILLSMLLEIYKIISLKQAISVNVPGLILAFVAAFLVGVFTIKIMIKITQKTNFKWFSLYLVIISAVSLCI